MRTAAPWLPLYYGGTFDPVHLGHLGIACAARDELGVPVRLMPAADPPHRAAPGADASQRTQMLRLAVDGIDDLIVDTCELERAARQPQRPSYSVETVEQLRAQRHGAGPLALLIGADSLLSLHTWHDWERLVGMAHLIVADRPGSALDGPLPAPLAAWLPDAWAASPETLARSGGGRVLRLHQPLHAESASQVRAAIGQGDAAWRELLPPAVADYIADRHLYGFSCSP